MEIVSDVLMILAWIAVGFWLRPTIGEIGDIKRGIRELFGKRG
ncbi:hypothetical protein CPT_Maja_039 [Burkholderia phage Maja]|uniref:Uncharacterized protein n=1 Tax=Burkholderia phage Maja TaxID=2767571 RepID=A0A7S6R8U1_9CAUD|nr:hypothetical protein CPT_Maja_039 [Burkholderia phage Maja]